MAAFFKIGCLLFAGWLAMFASPAEASWVPLRAEPRFRVSGMDFRTNQRMRRTLEIVADDERQTEFYDAGFVEDAVMILLQHMQAKGHLQPEVDIRFVTAKGETMRMRWSLEEPPLLDRSLVIRRVRFRMIPGRVFYYDQIDGLEPVVTEGETVFSREALLRFYYPVRFLIHRRSWRAYTEQGFRRSNANLLEALRREGFRDAEVQSRVISMDESSGAVKVAVNLVPGPRYRIRDRIIMVTEDNPDLATTVSVERVDVPWSRVWEQDTAIEVRNLYYAKGFAEARCSLTIEVVAEDREEIRVDAIAMLRTGPLLQTGSIRFEGRQHTREASLQRRLMLKTGDPLDPLLVERSRQRLAAMGSFQRVTVDVLASDPDDGSQRDVLFTLEEGDRLIVSLLAGYGSYELFRGGLEIEQNNLFGLGHRSRSMFVQSFKSTEADTVYTVPEFLAERVSGFTRLSALQREEVDFLRRELGISSGVRRYVPRWDVDISLRYTYELLRSGRFEEARDIGPARAAVGSVSTDVRWDQRDNPVYPRSGQHVHSRLEWAQRAFGGDAEYLIWELGGAAHIPAPRGLVWHVGTQHGIVKALGEQRDKLPFNKRFFPGGDRSLRGFRYGEAASLNEAGQVIGSEAFLLMQNELEQALTPSLHFLLFCDALLIGERLEDWPDGEWLLSAGAGLRLRTIVGPLRLEYGHNIRRRQPDPRGMVHVSVGFPF